MIRAIIIEDEYLSRELLKNFISDYTTDVDVVGEADSVTKGVDLVHQLSPNLVFLDIELKDGNGFEILQEVKNKDFLLVFLTGFKQYGVKAIRHNAFDYLLKPLVISHLVEVIERAKINLKEKQLLQDITKDASSINSSKIVIRNNQTTYIIPTEEILCVEASGNYCKIHAQNKNQILAHHTLTYYEDQLPNYFFKVHKSYLVNLLSVKEWTAKRSGEIILSSGKKIPLSSRRKKSFEMALKDCIHDHPTI